MNLPAKFQKPSQHNWDTLVAFDIDDKFVLEERNKHDTARYIAETALCVIVGLLLFGSYLLFILPEIALFSAYPGVSLSVGMVGIAVTLYAVATRGFKPQVGFNRTTKRIWVCKLNSQGHARIITYFPKTDVRSVFIQRPQAPHKEAALVARIKGKIGPVTLLRGAVVDIEAAHRELCAVLRDADIVRPVKPVRKVRLRTPRPERRSRPAAI